MNKREFILNTLIGYKNNPETCAYENDRCLYLTSDGRKCAVGKHLKEGEHQYCHGDVDILLYDYNSDDIFTDEAKQYDLSIREWDLMQKYHDYIAQDKNISRLNNIVTSLEEITKLSFPELKY